MIFLCVFYRRLWAFRPPPSPALPTHAPFSSLLSPKVTDDSSMIMKTSVIYYVIT